MKIQSYSDIITNSSSELFVFDNGESVESVIAQLDNIYPGWQSEYDKPKRIKNTDKEDLDMYLEYTNLGYMLPAAEYKRYRQKHNLSETDWIGIENFDKSDCYARNFAEELGNTPEKIYANWDKYNPFRHFGDHGYDTWLELTNEGYQLYKKKYGDKILLWSKGTNPNYEGVEKLDNIAHWIHLG